MTQWPNPVKEKGWEILWDLKIETKMDQAATKARFDKVHNRRENSDMRNMKTAFARQVNAGRRDRLVVRRSAEGDAEEWELLDDLMEEDEGDEASSEAAASTQYSEVLCEESGQTVMVPKRSLPCAPPGPPSGAPPEDAPRLWRVPEEARGSSG